MNSRIRFVRKENKMTQQEFADMLNVSHGSVQSWELGRAKPSSAAIQLICSKCNVNQTWLETGEGEPYAPQTKNQKIAEFVNQVMADEDEAFRKRYICALSNLPDEGWEMLENFLDELFESNE